jgi:hypothetical protein
MVRHGQRILSLRHIPSQSADPVPLATVSQAGATPMRAHIAEITAKVIIRSDTDPDQIPADLYSQIAEFIHSEDDLLDLGIELFTLPDDLGGSAPH